MWLVLLNISTFWQHYLGTVTFPGDFRSNYYPLTSYWIHLIQHGIFPHWTPYQNVGLPFLMTIQSGIFYPVLWIFTIPGFFEYNLHAANIVQALHILFGVIGFWVYARALGLGYGAALLGATAFHFFGGFYSNSDSADIVRAFAWLPWLFWTVHISMNQQKLLARNLLAPLIVYLFVTSSYVGNIMSQGFFLIVFCLLSYLNQLFTGNSNERLLTAQYLKLAGLCLLGLGLASIYFSPAIALMPWMDRSDGFSGFRHPWHWYYWNTLVMPTTYESRFAKATMISGFVTVPIFCLWFIMTKKIIQQQWLWMTIVFMAFAMAQGNHTFLFDQVVHVFSFLNYSRFPSSDYRGILCFALILLSAKIMDQYKKSDVALWRAEKAALVCCGLLAFYGLILNLSAWISNLPQEVLTAFVQAHKIISTLAYVVIGFFNGTILSRNANDFYITLAFAVLVFIVIFFVRKNGRLFIAGLLSLALVSGFYMICSTKNYWQVKELEPALLNELHIEGKPSIMVAIQNPPTSRPACRNELSWSGYLDGSYVCDSAGSIISIPKRTVDATPVLQNYLYQSWHAVSLSADQINQCNPTVNIAQGVEEKSIQQIQYGLQEVRYTVNAARDFCFVENEMAFPGWTATFSNKGQVVSPSSYCGALRSWCLPQGNYELTAQYRTPGLREGIALSLLCFMIYLLIIFRSLHRNP